MTPLDSPSWPIACQAARCAYLATLERVRDEAKAKGDSDWERAAQSAIDGDYSDIEHLIEQSAADEAEAEQAFAYEMREAAAQWCEQRGDNPSFVQWVRAGMAETDELVLAHARGELTPILQTGDAGETQDSGVTFTKGPLT
jgi:hypothetical protein